MVRSAAVDTEQNILEVCLIRLVCLDFHNYLMVEALSEELLECSGRKLVHFDGTLADLFPGMAGEQIERIVALVERTESWVERQCWNLTIEEDLLIGIHILMVENVVYLIEMVVGMEQFGKSIDSLQPLGLQPHPSLRSQHLRLPQNQNCDRKLSSQTRGTGRGNQKEWKR